MTAVNRAKAAKVREALTRVVNPPTDYAVQVRYPGQVPYIHDDGLSEEAAGTIADSLNRSYGLGRIATVVPCGAAHIYGSAR